MAVLDYTDALAPIREKVDAGERLDFEDGLQLLESDDSFPKPVAVISAGRIWRRRDVEVWGRATGRLA